MADFNSTTSDNDVKPWSYYDVLDDFYNGERPPAIEYSNDPHTKGYAPEPYTSNHINMAANPSQNYPQNHHFPPHLPQSHTHYKSPSQTSSLEQDQYSREQVTPYYYNNVGERQFSANSSNYDPQYDSQYTPQYDPQYYDQQEHLDTNDSSKRKLSRYDEHSYLGPKKDTIRPMKPVRQSSNPNIPKRKIKPQLHKSYSYNIDSPAVSTPPSTKSLFEYKKKPNFHLNLDHLKNSSVHSFDSINSQTTPTIASGLHIQDSDLNSEAELDKITPSMKPPGTNQHDYFENLLTPNIPQPTDLSGFDFDVFDKEFYHDNEQYDDSQNINPGIKINDYENIDPQNQIHHLNKHQKSSSRDHLGYNFDHYDTSQSSGDNDKNKLTFTELNIEKKSPQTPLSNSPTSRSPGLFRTLSNQSTSSVTSGSSLKESTGSTATKKKKIPKGSTCSICGKFISRDLSRHLRIHDEVGRFRCVFPNFCYHKTGKFNRPYDYKKHLLHFHFVFDNKRGKAANNLTDKLPLIGNCKHCNYRCTAGDWIDNHILTDDTEKKCPYITGDPNPI